MDQLEYRRLPITSLSCLMSNPPELQNGFDYSMNLPAGRSRRAAVSFCILCRPRYAGLMAETDTQQGNAGPITLESFQQIDIRVGTIVDAKPFPEARKPALQLWIDFGEAIGIKRSSAQITVHYKPDQLIGRQVCAVVNFAPRQIGPFISEVLTLGLPSDEGEVILLRPDFTVPDGGRLY
jgi:tRNA-binding protein